MPILLMETKINFKVIKVYSPSAVSLRPLARKRRRDSRVHLHVVVTQPYKLKTKNCLFRKAESFNLKISLFGLFRNL